MRALVRALVLGGALGLLAPTGSAHASGAPGPLLVDDDVLVSIALMNVALPMLVVDLALLAIDRPLPPGLAVLQIAVVGLLLPLSVLATIDGAGFERAERDVIKGTAIFSLIWFTGHGIYSLWRYEALQKEQERADALWRGDAAVRSLTDS